jgi:hypothetical protein
VTKVGAFKHYWVPALMMLGVAGAPHGAQADAGEHEWQARQASPPAPTPQAIAIADAHPTQAMAGERTIAGERTRAHSGSTDLYVPTFFRPVAGTYDLVVHFHGISSVQEENFELAGVNAVIVSVNLGVASDTYSSAFSTPRAFDALLANTQRMLDKTQRAPGAHLGRIALSAWSAGFAAVGAILRQPGVAERIDAILLADGPHTNYMASHQVNDKGLERWARFADAAARNEKLFALTHSSIPTIGYPSTTETIGELLKLTSLEKGPVDGIGPRGMRPIYESSRGDFHVAGFEGQTARDHIDHIKAMGETLLPYLRDFWSRGR